VPPPTQPGD